MRIAYLDLIGGLSGDMFLAALLDAGLPEKELAELLCRIPGALELDVWEEEDFGLRVRRLKIKASEPGQLPSRRKELLSLVSSLTIPQPVRKKVLLLLDELFRAEAKVHGLPPDKVHLHELSAYDTLADLIGVVWGLERLGVEALYSSPVPLGRALVQTAHGPLPVPAPATLELLRGLPIKGFEEEGETVTPTGALLLRGLVKSFAPIPLMKLQRIGIGAGSRRWQTCPNVVRVFLGESERSGIACEEVWEMVTDLDDETPETLGEVCDKLRRAGALDVSLCPLFMKKGRPGVRLTVLTRPEEMESLRDVLFRETRTLGVRLRETKRWVRPRRIISVETPLGPVRVKVSEEPELIFKPEWDDIKRISEESGRSLNEVKRMVWEAIYRHFRLLHDRLE